MICAMYRIFINDDHVPAEEFAALTRLLDEHNIIFTERPRWIGSIFRFGARGAGADLMVETEQEYQRARELINEWQQDMIAESRATFEANRGKNRVREIVGWILAALIIGGLLWLSLGIGKIF